MKKRSKTYLGWLLITMIIVSIPRPIYAEGDAESSILSIESAVEQNKKIPLRAKLRLISRFKELREAVKQKFRRRRTQPVLAQSLEDLKERYAADLKIANIKRVILTLLANMGLITLSVVSAILTFGATLPADMIVVAWGMMGLPQLLKRYINSINATYHEQAYKALFLPKTRERIQLIQKIRERKAVGSDSKEVNVLQQQLDKLNHELEQIVSWAKSLTGEDFDRSHKFEIRIETVLAKYNKHITKGSPLFKLFEFAFNKDDKRIDLFLEAGNVALFDEPWVWPAVAELYYFGDMRPIEILIKELQQKVHWDIWKSRLRG